MAGSFWSNFGLRFQSSSSGIDEILERGNFSLEEIISHDQVIQECKYMNQQLCEYLSQPKIVRKLVEYVITVPPGVKDIQPASLDVGGSSDEGGGITTAASIKRKRDKIKAAAASASSSAAATSSDSTVPPTDPSSSTDPTVASASSSSSSSLSSSSSPSSSSSGDESRAKADAESGDSSFNTSGSSASAHSSDDEEGDDSNVTKSDPEKKEDEKAEKEAKYPYQASELFSCEVASMLDAIFEPESEMDKDHSGSGSGSTPSNAALDKVTEGDESATATGGNAAATDDAAASTSPSSPLSPNTPTAASSSAASSTVTSPAPASSSPSSPRLPILDLLLSFLDQPAPIDPAHASYFRKVMVVLIQRKYEPLVKYMASHGTLDKLLNHIGLYSAMEVLIMIGWDDGLGGQQDVAWLVESDLTGKLIEKLNPEWDQKYNQPDVLINASRALVDVVVKCAADRHNPLITRLLAHPCQQLLFKHMFSGSPLSLSNALSIVIVLVQRYANRMDLGEEIMDEVKAAALAAQAAALDAPDEDVLAATSAAASSDPNEEKNKLPEPFYSLVPHLAQILRLLHSEHPAAEQFSYGPGRAFGETRLKVVELILVLVRCKVQEVEQIFVSENLLSTLLEAFVSYPWNNMLHGLVESIVRTILEFLEKTILKPALFLEARLPQRLMDAYEKNEQACLRGKGFRLGYMGHLLRTAEVVELYLKECEGSLSAEGMVCTPADPVAARAERTRVLGSAEMVERWDAFVKGPLALEGEKQKVVVPSMGGGDDDQFDDDADALAAMGASFGQQHQQQQGGGAGGAKQSGQGDSQSDYAFDDPDDSSNFAYEYRSSQLDPNSQSNWADFNTHFSEASVGESPSSAAAASAGAGAGALSADGGKIARTLLEFQLNADEDADDSEEEEGDDWARFDSTPSSSAAAAAPAAGSAPGGVSAPPPPVSPSLPEPAAAGGAADDFGADFAVDFPPAQ